MSYALTIIYDNSNFESHKIDYDTYLYNCKCLQMGGGYLCTGGDRYVNVTDAKEVIFKQLS